MDGAPGWGFVVSHPSHKNKDVARVGHPNIAGINCRINSGAIVVSHPFRKKRGVDGAPGIVVTHLFRTWNLNVPTRLGVCGIPP
jgi:hypothetical protein